MKLKDLLKLQLFADDSGSGDGGSPEPGGNPGGGSDPEGDDPNDGGDDDDDPEPEKKYTVEEVNNLIKRKKAEWEKNRQKEDDEAKKLSKMNAQEKAEYKQQQLEKRIQELEDEKTLSGMRDEARKQLSEKGINISDELRTHSAFNTQLAFNLAGKFAQGGIIAGALAIGADFLIPGIGWAVGIMSAAALIWKRLKQEKEWGQLLKLHHYVLI